MSIDSHDELSSAYEELRQEYEIIRDNNDKLAAEYQALAAQLAAAEREREALIELIRNVHGTILDARIDATLERQP